ncbi:UNVERIFIED_CONTAM: Transcription factor [Sesamum latifolium]|uniref:Transcription factor n=1 Tax=Sesamum latifolium TaxID=2727402 RepID=A0AAW2XRP4_9LAMI
MEDYNFDHEMFDLKPIIPEIYTPVVQQPQTSGRSNAANGMRRMMMMSSSTSWNSCDPHQIIMNTNPSSNSSPPPSATASAPTQLISFQNSNTSSYLPPHSDTAPNCDHNYNLEMSKDYVSSTPQVISFSANWADHEDDCGLPDNQYHDAANGPAVSNKRVCTASRTPLQAQDHLVAERKRRERLGQLFITLSKVVPGLKKLDKASLLEDAIKYLKALQERVNALEEEDQVVKKSSNMMMNMDDHDDNSSSHNYNIGSTISTTTTDQSSAEIRARISNRHVLIKICCRKQMGLISRIPCEMEKMHLSVIDMRVMPFGGAALDITILAEMHSEFRGTVKEIVGHLQMSFLNAEASA